MNTINRIKENFNPILEIKGVLLTMHDERTNLSRQIEDELQELFQIQSVRYGDCAEYPPVRGPSFGKPIQLYDIKSAGARAYMSLAKEMMGK